MLNHLCDIQKGSCAPKHSTRASHTHTLSLIRFSIGLARMKENRQHASLTLQQQKMTVRSTLPNHRFINIQNTFIFTFLQIPIMVKVLRVIPSTFLSPSLSLLLFASLWYILFHINTGSVRSLFRFCSICYLFWSMRACRSTNERVYSFVRSFHLIKWKLWVHLPIDQASREKEKWNHFYGSLWQLKSNMVGQNYVKNDNFSN